MKRIVVAALAAAALTLAACGSDAEPTAEPTESTESTGETAAAAGTTVDITIADGQVSPQGERVEVKAGEPITLRVTSDAADEIHVHADPEEELEVEAGDEAKELTFTLKTPGQVAVESHETDRTIVQLVVR